MSISLQLVLVSRLIKEHGTGRDADLWFSLLGPHWPFAEFSISPDVDLGNMTPFIDVALGGQIQHYIKSVVWVRC